MLLIVNTLSKHIWVILYVLYVGKKAFKHKLMSKVAGLVPVYHGSGP